MKMISVSLSLDEAKRLFDALENVTGNDSIDRFVENLGYRIEAADKS